MKKRLFAFIIFSLLIVPIGFVEAADLVVYAALDEQTPREIIKAFQERMGLRVELALQIENRHVADDSFLNFHTPRSLQSRGSTRIAGHRITRPR